MQKAEVKEEVKDKVKDSIEFTKRMASTPKIEKRTKTTTIEKKYKDKKTGDWKSVKIEYAKVPDRLQKFWEDNPRGKIETKPHFVDGQVMFEAHIHMDKADEYSREVTGHTFGTKENEKDFEKLETLAVGRALALLGYAGSGEIASSEEMEEYHKFQEQKKQQIVEESREWLESAKDLNDLKSIWSAIPPESKKELEEDKNKIKESFKETK